MLQSTPMLSRQDSADTRACQRDDPARPWTGAGTVDTRSLIAAVARAYNDIYCLEIDVTPAAILGPSRATHVVQARHLCAYLLAADYHLTNSAAAHALGRADHTTALNSRARIAAALPHDTRLARVLDRVRADLAGNRRATTRTREHGATRAAGKPWPRHLRGSGTSTATGGCAPCG